MKQNYPLFHHALKAMSSVLTKTNLVNTETSIDTAIHGTAREKKAVTGTMKEYLGLTNYEVSET